jgi:hypothetical protein
MMVISAPVDLSSAASASIGSRRRATSTRSCPSFAASREGGADASRRAGYELNRTG